MRWFVRLVKIVSDGATTGASRRSFKSASIVGSCECFAKGAIRCQPRSHYTP